uniref:Uncharacterized protein n=1 Tax=Arundo donax TaxID=35708 RepID=A0A0A8Z9Q9_ARUDO
MIDDAGRWWRCQEFHHANLTTSVIRRK